MLKVGVCLSGCGVYDGAEILVLLTEILRLAAKETHVSA